MSTLRVLAFAESFQGTKASNLDAHIFEEYNLLAKKVKLSVISEDVESYVSQNIKIIKVPKISNPIILRTVVRILGYSYDTIKYRNEYDIVYTRSLALNFLFASILAKKILKKN